MTTFEDKYGILEIAAGNNFQKLNASSLEEKEDLDKHKQQIFNKIKMQRKRKYAWKHGKFI